MKSFAIIGLIGTIFAIVAGLLLMIFAGGLFGLSGVVLLIKT